MAQAGLFASPMSRKKTVAHKYSPNTWRVISQDAENSASARQTHNRDSQPTNAVDYRNIIGQKSSDILHPTADFRNNRPNPRSVGFLRQDVALLNEPVCDVRTRNTSKEQSEWWPARENSTKATIPSHTLDTTARSDFQYRGAGLTLERSKGPLANGNPEGIVPVTKLAAHDNRPRFWSEKISYEHQFNSRRDPQYSSRAQRHGHFVLSRMKDEDVTKVIGDAALLSSSNNDRKQSEKPSSASGHSPPPNSQPSAALLTPVE